MLKQYFSDELLKELHDDRISMDLDPNVDGYLKLYSYYTKRYFHLLTGDEDGTGFYSVDEAEHLENLIELIQFVLCDLFMENHGYTVFQYCRLKYYDLDTPENKLWFYSHIDDD